MKFMKLKEKIFLNILNQSLLHKWFNVVIVKVRTSPVQKLKKSQKSPGDILTLND